MHDGKICVALVGIGWAGTMHAKAYNHIHSLAVDLKTVCALESTVGEFVEKYNFRTFTKDFDEVLLDEEIDVIDIATPPKFHGPMVIRAMRANKHVICEKPLSGYFGMNGDPESIAEVSKKKMLLEVRKTMDEIEAVMKETGKKFFYSENWIYAPSFLRACQLIKAKGTTVVHFDSFLCHKGSPAEYVKIWAKSGGGTLSRNLIHPLSAAIYLKRLEMESKGLEYGVRSILCDCSQVTRGIENRYIEADPVDTEDWSHAIITFNDGTKATLTAADTFVGESVNRIEIYGNDAIMKCNFAPNNLLDVYFSDDKGLENEFITEKDDHKLGWKHAAISEEMIRGYYVEIQDFMECIKYNREPMVGFEHAREVADLIQIAYYAAEQKKCVEIADLL